MAGIGFVLERIVERQGIRGIARVALVGVFVVAGPWIISSIALAVVSLALGAGRAHFFGAIVYIYAGTLIAFGGYHYLLTRVSADLLYEKRYAALAVVHNRTRRVAALVALPLGVLVAWTMPGSMGAVAAVVATLSVSVGWIEMLLVSMVRNERPILLSYGAGAMVMGGGVLLWWVVPTIAADPVSYGMAVFAIGHLVTTLSLMGVVSRVLRNRARLQGSVRRRKRTIAEIIGSKEKRYLAEAEAPGTDGGTTHTDTAAERQESGSKPGAAVPDREAPPVTAGIAMPRRGILGFSLLPRETLWRVATVGVLLVSIIWADKLIYWFSFGGPVDAAGLLHLYPRYDLVVFLSQLLLIPPMILFVVRSETALSRGVRTILRDIRGGVYRDVIDSKAALRDRLRRALGEQAIVHLMMVVIAWLLAPDLLGTGAGAGAATAGGGGADVAAAAGAVGPDVALLVRTTAAGQLYFLLYSAIVTLLYISDYRLAVSILTGTLMLAVAGAAATALAGLEALVGWSYLIAAGIGAAVAVVAQDRRISIIDQLVLMRFNL